MRIDRDLAILTAQAAFSEPFRQIKPMTTYDFRKWLSDRGFRIQNWQTLHFLWREGVYAPIAISRVAIDQTPGLGDSERFVPTICHDGEQLYGDLGMVIQGVGELPWGWDDIKNLSKSLWWHPLQLFQFYRFEWIVQQNWSLDTHLRDAGTGFLDWERHHRIQARATLTEEANSDESVQFRQMLALLLLVEPIVHATVHQRIQYGVTESIRQYYEWREQLMAEDLLLRVGLSREQAIEWHQKFSIQAY